MTSQVEPARVPGVKLRFGTHRAPGLVTAGPLMDDCFPFVSVGSAFPWVLLVAAGHNSGGVEHCLSSNFRVLGLQVIKTGKDFVV